MSDPTEQERLLADTVRIGVIQAVDRGPRPRCDVRVAGGQVIGPMPWLAGAYGELAVWRPPTPGEQVIVVQPEGDPNRAVALPGVPRDAFAIDNLPTDEDVKLVAVCGPLRLVVRGETLVITCGGEDGAALVIAPDHLSVRFAHKWMSFDPSPEYGVIHSVDTTFPDVHKPVDDELRAL